MRRETLMTIYKKDDEYGLKVPAGTEGRDIEIALATTIVQLADHQRIIEPGFKTETLLEKIASMVLKQRSLIVSIKSTMTL